MSEIKVYLLDVEGTVAPISFVYEQLFPYARKRMANFLAESLTDSSVVADLALLVEEYRTEKDADVPGLSSHGFPEPFASDLASETCGQRKKRFRAAGLQCVVAYLQWLMDRDRKSTALKSLQGKIWKSGFESGELKGELFPDVPAALKRWSELARVAIYSSGSVEAQRLLFRYSNFGDLTGLIAANFDTQTGPKQAPASYAAIAAAMKVDPAEVLFFSDVVPELDAAREAGCQTRLVAREGNAPVADTHGHMVIDSFEQT